MKKPTGLSVRTSRWSPKNPLEVFRQVDCFHLCACDENGQGNPFSVYMYGVFLAEVAVDTKTGKTEVTGMTFVADLGKIVNRLVVDGQMYGGIVQGIGLALTEDFEDLKKHTTIAGCGIPYTKDAPDKIDIIYVETPREHGPFGAAGVGELP